MKSRHTISAHRNADALKAFINLNCGELMSSSDHAVHNLRREYHGRIGHLKSHTGKTPNYEETGKVWFLIEKKQTLVRNKSQPLHIKHGGALCNSGDCDCFHLLKGNATRAIKFLTVLSVVLFLFFAANAHEKGNKTISEQISGLSNLPEVGHYKKQDSQDGSSKMAIESSLHSAIYSERMARKG